jgi:hypothetical protein
MTASTQGLVVVRVEPSRCISYIKEYSYMD